MTAPRQQEACVSWLSLYCVTMLAFCAGYVVCGILHAAGHESAGRDRADYRRGRR